MGGRRESRCGPGRQATARLLAAWASTAKTCSRATPRNHSTESSRLAPPSRFSKSAFTGTRAPRNTQAPPERSGERSTASQEFQSIVT